MCVSTVAGQEDCWLLTETLVQSVSLQLKACLNIQCLALHSFTDLHPGKAEGLVTNQLILVRIPVNTFPENLPKNLQSLTLIV